MITLRIALRWYARQLRRLAQQAMHCRRNGHLDLCQVQVFSDGTQRHIHVCAWCEDTTLDLTGDIENDVRALLADLGLPLDPGMAFEDQSRFMH